VKIANAASNNIPCLLSNLFPWKEKYLDPARHKY